MPNLPGTDSQRALLTRRLLLLYNSLILVLLVIFWYGYERGWHLIADLVKNPAVRVALYSVWFATLGGVAISFKGITDHWRLDEWPRGRWGLWYFSRPLNGIIVGSVVYVALQVANTSSPPSTPVVSVAAFILGMQEKRFYAFLTALGNVVLTVPGGDTETFEVREVVPNTGKPDDTVLVVGSGFAKDATVTIGSAPLHDAQLSPDGGAIAGKVPPGTGAVDVVVALPDGTARTLKGGFTYE